MKRGNCINFQQLVSSSRDRVATFRSIPVNDQGFTLLSLSSKIKNDLMTSLTDQELCKLFAYLDPDKITDLLQLLEKKRRDTLLKTMSEQLRDKITLLLKSDPNTAAGLMNLHYLEIQRSFTIQEVANLLRKHEKRTGKIPTLLVVEKGYLQGELLMHSLALASPKDSVDKYVHK